MANIYSMTGSGHAHANSKNFCVNIQLRGVNNRFLDFNLRTEDMAVQSMYPDLREILSQHINRGKIECTVLVEKKSAQDIEVDVERIKALSRIEKIVSEYLPLQKSDITHILNCTGVLITPQISDDELSDLIKDTFKNALELLITARKREGENLKNAINMRLDSISSGLEIINSKLPELAKLERERLLKHLQTLNCDITFDQNRLEQEIVLMAERDDIQEEYDRLCSHVSEVRNILLAGGLCGKRLDFMMQEFNREANTMASKTSSLELTRVAVDFKVLIEQMREQIQNIE